MAKASMNVQPVKVNSSEAHNLRKKKLDYVVEKDSHLNQSVVYKEIKPALAEIKERYAQLVKQKWQDKATPIREGVVNLSEKTTMEDLQKLATRLKDKFGIETLQIHMHKDEGHFLKDQPEVWKPNLHAHMVFDWTDHKTGKCISLKRFQLTEMQDIVAEVLQMERGQSSNVKHLNSLQFKNKMEAQNMQQLLAENQKLKEENERLMVGQSLKKGLSKLVGTDTDTAKIKELEKNYNELYKQYLQLGEMNQKLKQQTQQLSDSLKAVLPLTEENKRLGSEVARMYRENRDFDTLNTRLIEGQKWIAVYRNHLIALTSEKSTPERKKEALDFAEKVAKKAEESKLIKNDPKKDQKNGLSI